MKPERWRGVDRGVGAGALVAGRACELDERL